MTTVILLIASLGMAQAKKAKKTTETQETSAQAVVPKTTAKANIPDDSNSKKYAKKLLSTTFTEFVPDVEGLIYHKLKFNTDNSWTSDAAVVTPDGEMDCIESGTWTMDGTESTTVSTLALNITSTDCPSRESGVTVRFRATLRGSSIDAQFR